MSRRKIESECPVCGGVFSGRMETLGHVVERHVAYGNRWMSVLSCCPCGKTRYTTTRGAFVEPAQISLDRHLLEFDDEIHHLQEAIIVNSASEMGSAPATDSFSFNFNSFKAESR